MRFLILTQYFPPEVGAPQMRLSAIARELTRRGHQIEVVTALPNYPTGRVFPGYRHTIVRRERQDGVPVIRTWIVPATGTSIVKRLVGYVSFTLSSFFGCLMSARPDYVVVESPPLFLGLTGYVYSRLRRIPFILNVSDLWPASARELGFVRNATLLRLAEGLERFLYRKAYRVCAVTRGICAEVQRIGGRIPPPVYLPNGVDTDLFRRSSTPGNGLLASGEIAFTYAGTHGYAQGLDVIVDAARELRDRADIVFLMIGDGPEKARLGAMAAEYGLTNLRFFPGRPPSAMPAVFSASRATIVPLRPSPLFRSARPSKILPSLACETPVIFCGEGDAAALLEEHRCGLVVPPGMRERLAEAVRTLADRPALAAEMGRNGRRLVAEEYGWDRIVGRWLDELGVALP